MRPARLVPPADFPAELTQVSRPGADGTCERIIDMDVTNLTHRSRWDSVLTPDTTEADLAILKLRQSGDVPAQLMEAVQESLSSVGMDSLGANWAQGFSAQA